MNTRTKVILYIFVLLLVSALSGFLMRSIGSMITDTLSGEGYKVDLSLFLQWKTWALGAVGAFFVFLIWVLSGSNLDSLLMEKSGGMLGTRRVSRT